MIKDLIDELKRIDDRLSPININFHNVNNVVAVILVYKDIECIISRNVFSLYSYDDDEMVKHLIYSNDYTKIFDLIMLLHNNKDKITEIILRYI